MLLVAALLAGILLVGGYGIHVMRGEQQRAAAALERTRLIDGSADHARSTALAFKTQVQEWKNILLRGHEKADHDRYVAALQKRSATVLDELAQLERGLVRLGRPVDEVVAARKLHGELNEHYAQALKKFEPGNRESSYVVDGLVRGKDRPLDEKLEAVVAQLHDAAEKDATRVSADSAERASTVLALMAGILLAMIVLGAGLGLWIVRGITRPLQHAVSAARKVAGGDLTINLHTESRDEIGELLQALSEMSRNLRALVGEVAAGAHAVADSSAQIAQGNLDLSQRTEEQASTLEETASQMEELTSTVTQNADNARQATQVAAGAAQVAQQGGAVVGQVVATMTGISESSRRISDIIGVIDGIAFQTNILALNAAVEAARAGEQGRGFAVVAAEVRNLAQRSATAAKEIKALIGDSVGKIETGSRLVDDAGRTMQDVVASVRKVNDLIAEIAAASQEQSAGIEQVNSAVTQMDQVVQQNASLVEEATAATESMKAQAQVLLERVGRFRLHQGDAPAPAPAQAPSAFGSAPAPIQFRPAARQQPAWTAIGAAAPKLQQGDWREF
ncbi:MAG TPA: methyl-accepting chemotaxis protein [Ramlibacter sp.]|jgi:methyl-accepting chemotaxis protein-1 (serine sensor receptor)|nr:methyl-accepting chemotaxis protein [Ramlibacter sp.]